MWTKHTSLHREATHTHTHTHTKQSIVIGTDDRSGLKAPAPTETGAITTDVGSNTVLCQIGNLHEVLVIVTVIWILLIACCEFRDNCYLTCLRQASWTTHLTVMCNRTNLPLVIQEKPRYNKAKKTVSCNESILKVADLHNLKKEHKWRQNTLDGEKVPWAGMNTKLNSASVSPGFKTYRHDFSRSKELGGVT
jgi:hypothetical protein